MGRACFPLYVLSVLFLSLTTCNLKWLTLSLFGGHVLHPFPDPLLLYMEIPVLFGLTSHPYHLFVPLEFLSIPDLFEKHTNTVTSPGGQTRFSVAW